MLEYWKGTLSNPQRRAYESIYSAAKRKESSVRIREKIASEEIQRTFQCLTADHPELYHLGPQLSAAISPFGIELRLQSIYDIGEQRRIEAALQTFRAFLQQMKALSELEAEKQIAEKLVLNTVYDIDMFRNQNAAAAICFGKAQCSGIASAVKLAMDEVGIWCIRVDGDVASNAGQPAGPHAWNIVKIDGMYYHLDVTMMLGANMAKSLPLRYWMFNCSDATMKAQGYHWDESQTPPCTSDADATGDMAEEIPAFDTLYAIHRYAGEQLQQGCSRFSFSVRIPQYNEHWIGRMILQTVTDQLRKRKATARVQISSRAGRYTVEIEY